MANYYTWQDDEYFEKDIDKLINIQNSVNFLIAYLHRIKNYMLSYGPITTHELQERAGLLLESAAPNKALLYQLNGNTLILLCADGTMSDVTEIAIKLRILVSRTFADVPPIESTITLFEKEPVKVSYKFAMSYCLGTLTRSRTNIYDLLRTLQGQLAMGESIEGGMIHFVSASLEGAT